MHIAGGNAAVKQREPLPLAQLVHNVGGNVRQIVQPVACGLQLAHNLHGVLFSAQHPGPLLNAGLYLKHAVGAGGIFQHTAVGLLTADGAAVKVLPFRTAENEGIGLLLGQTVHKMVHQKILRRKVHNNAAEIKDNILIHTSLRKGAGFSFPIIHGFPAGNNSFFAA